MAKKKIEVDGLNIQIKTEGEQDYISITDIAKRSSSNRPATTIQSWLRNQSTISYLGTWEKVYNQNFKVSHLADFRDFASDNRSAVTPKAWIEATGAIGITSTSGRYGGTYAHSDIALEFCTWLSPEFKVYFVKEFQRLKEQEAKQLNIEWNIRRELAKAHYPMLKEAVINHLPQKTNKTGFYLADEADLINKLVFGMTAKQWRKKYPNLKGNMRDNATIEQLLLITDLQVVDSLLIKWDCDKQMRTELLEKFAQDLRRHFVDSPAVARIKEIQDKALK